MSASTPPADAEQSTRSPVFGVVTDAQTYKNLLYLLVRFPLGIAYFVVLVAGVTLGAVLAIFLVGFAILATVIAGATYAGSLETVLANQLLGTDISYEPHDPGEEPLVEYTKGVLTDVQSYVLLAYMALSFPVGIGLFTLAAIVLTFSLVAILAPFTYWLPFTEYQIANIDGVGQIVVDTLPEALALAAVGVVTAFLGLHLCNALARLHGVVTATVLDQDR